MINPPQAMRDHLSAAGIGLTTGTNLFTGGRRAVGNLIPANAVFIIGAPGLSIRAMGEVEEVIRTIITITLRWSSFAAGDSKMREIHDKIRGKTVAGFLDVLALDGEPIPLGKDGDGNELFLLTAEMVFTQLQAA